MERRATRTSLSRTGSTPPTAPSADQTITQVSSADLEAQLKHYETIYQKIKVENSRFSSNFDPLREAAFQVGASLARVSFNKKNSFRMQLESAPLLKQSIDSNLKVKQLHTCKI